MSIGSPDKHASSDRRAPMPEPDLSLVALERHYQILARAGKHGAREQLALVRHLMRVEAWVEAERRTRELSGGER
jgi:ABC-type Mn2+/Zn2+ transport system ATPase subunit